MAQLITTSSELESILSEKRTIGLVPTMGNLHEGHLSLIKKSLEENQNTVISIFVNPTQFAPNEDFDAYPRTLEQDISKIKEISSAQNVYIFSPKSVQEIYPPDFKTTIKVPCFDNILCASTRPRHFEGVCTVVYRLFTIVNPHRAYFGQKDYQQLKIIQQMAADLFPKINIVSIPTFRSHNGLALSSRNNYLDSDKKKTALTLFKKLKEIESHIKNHPSKEHLDELIQKCKKINSVKEKDIKWDYLSVLDASTLKEINNKTKQILIAGAIHVKDVRLIDNIVINKEL